MNAVVGEVKIVYIEWLDSATRRGWEPADGGSPTVIRSIGIEVARCRESITISTSYNGGTLYADQMVIPMKAVTKIRRVKL